MYDLRPLSDVLKELSERCPEVPMLALGQTVLWDEPMKAVLQRYLPLYHPRAVVWMGVMDTDYFSKPPFTVSGRGEYRLFPHNDGSTKEIWVAAGELSRLFGCEVVPTRDMYSAHGVQLEAVAKNAPEGRRAFIDKVTEAWGWLGLVNTGSRRMLSGDVPLRDVFHVLIEQVQWALESTADSLRGSARDAALRQAERLRSWIEEFFAANPSAKLVELYLELGPRLCEFLLGRSPERLRTVLSSKLLRFNTDTVRRPLFRVLDLFLNPQTGETLKSAYNQTVAGSEIYTLDKFGEGAVPFELVVPGHGRGTICITGDRITVQADEPIHIKAAEPIHSAAQLAAAVESVLGKDVSLIGKAVTLLCMLGAEFVVVFNETASQYVWRTERMTALLRDQGIQLPLFPILRLVYPTWDTMREANVEIHLPEHLAQAFGKETVSSAEFSGRWRQVCAEQENELEKMKRLSSPVELLSFLAERDSETWSPLLEEYLALKNVLLSACEQINNLKRRTQELYSRLRELKRQCELIAREKGNDYRTCVAPLKERLWHVTYANPGSDEEATQLMRRIAQEEERRKVFDMQWARVRSMVVRLRAEISKTRAERRAVETSSEVMRARRRIQEIALRAQEAKLWLVRNAYLTSKGLYQTCYRPSSWWIPLLSPDGRWFDAIAKETKAYLEPLSTSAELCRCGCGSQAKICRNKEC